MLKYVLFGSVAVLICVAVQAHAAALPNDEIDRAIACSVYGGFASDADPRTVPTKIAINRMVEAAVASGARSQAQVNDLFYETMQQAMDREPRGELSANWNECAKTFAQQAL